MEQDPDATGLSGGKVRAVVVAGVANLVSLQGENLTRAAEVSCCGGICPTCAPVVAANLILPSIARRLGKNQKQADKPESDINDTP